ncbi:MAG: cyclase family protein [Chloroflexi bacterium]|nr:cyclase family protein [Chloroflexota bacterium]
MKARKIYDVSLTIQPGMLVWPGNAPVTVDTVKALSRGDSSNVSLLHIGTHTGTHVDAPRHFIPDAPGVDNISPEVLVGPTRLFHLPQVHRLDRPVLEKLDLTGVARLLLGTHNSTLLRKQEFDSSYTFLTEDGARYLAEEGIRLVGIDYLSIEEYQKPGRPAHHVLLGAGMVIIEGLDLAGVPAGDYDLLCLPLKLKDGDGAPARVFLREL